MLRNLEVPRGELGATRHISRVRLLGSSCQRHHRMYDCAHPKAPCWQHICLNSTKKGSLASNQQCLCSGHSRSEAGADTPRRFEVEDLRSIPPRLQIGFAESHAAAVKHTVITIEKTIGRIKRYLQLTTVMAAKQRARAHTVTRMTAKVSAERPANCHANAAANR
jgi:hypothetical protein